MKNRTNFRLEIFPQPPYFGKRSDERNRELCDEMVEQIKRHVDGVGSVEIVCDEVCSHCGSRWEDNPECCNAAIEESEKAKGGR